LAAPDRIVALPPKRQTHCAQIIVTRAWSTSKVLPHPLAMSEMRVRAQLAARQVIPASVTRLSALGLE